MASVTYPPDFRTTLLNSFVNLAQLRYKRITNCHIHGLQHLMLAIHRINRIIYFMIQTHALQLQGTLAFSRTLPKTHINRISEEVIFYLNSAAGIT